ncbi:hypothetical protein BO71DRAFT_486563 [Aspergillus ellipticus CBS 707.79]|uniref:Uncharacterized protein n=1 Tax=Aspergillus ellipticus CBS 707.79 TaxID=1448320 RepID=A0A319D0S0_9EURO|nr:hypothetical protein BO71DRAFT_486563 [Aspergillus ellipticus CBS 707.79]
MPTTKSQQHDFHASPIPTISCLKPHLGSPSRTRHLRGSHDLAVARSLTPKTASCRPPRDFPSHPAPNSSDDLLIRPVPLRADEAD